MSRCLAAFRAGREYAVSSAPKSKNPEKGENPGSGASAEEFSGFSPFSDFGRAETAPAADPDDARERAAMADHYAAPPDASPWRPGDPDPLRDGLLAGWRANRSGRLSALAQRLEAARPRRTWGVREMEAAALAAEAAGDFGPLAPSEDRCVALDGLLRGFAGTEPQPTLEDLA